MEKITTIKNLREVLQSFCEPAYAESVRRFFKTGPGDYAEHDRFMGVRMPNLRRLARQAEDFSLSKIQGFLRSSWHEERMLALLILLRKFRKLDEREAVYDFYGEHFSYVNNWDLVDASAPVLIGEYWRTRSHPQALKILMRWARSACLWERRIAMVGTLGFIRAGYFEPTFVLAKTLFKDPHDLMHKAVGWMLREVGKRDRPC